MPQLQREKSSVTKADDRRDWRLSPRLQRLLLSLILAMSALIVLGALRIALSVDGLLGGGASIILAGGLAAFGTGFGLGLGCLLAVPLLRYGHGDGDRGLPALDTKRVAPGIPPRATATAWVVGLVALDAAMMRGLSKGLPFRFGLLSCLYYCLPSVLLAFLAPPRSRARLLISGTVLVAGLLLILPVRALQQHVAAQAWLDGSSAAGRTQAQVVVLPGLVQEAYGFDGRTLIANFDTVQDGTSFWSAVETVTPGTVDPSGPILVADGDGDDTEDLACTQVGAGLWRRTGSLGQGGGGFVLQRDGVTITLTQGPDLFDPSVLSRALLAAHPASDAELWSREGSARYSFIDVLLL